MAAAADASGNNGAARRVVLLGPPNSGKGTQAAVLAEHMGVPTISTGDMLRAAKAAGTPLGKKVAQIMADGQLVDDETMRDLVRERLAEADCEGGFLLDGYPRTRVQVDHLEEIIGCHGEKGAVDRVLLIKVPDEELLRRGLARGREDDTEEVIAERLRVYDEETRPLVGYYRDLGLLAEIDGHQEVDQVTADLLEAL